MPNTTRPSLISGGHRGAEAEFGRCAKRWGIDQTTLSFEGHAMEWPVGVKVLSDEPSSPPATSRWRSSRSAWGATYHEADLIRRVIQSLYHMVNDTWQVFAIGWIQPDDTVKGGTGWGVELAKLFNRQVWVFDQGRHEWFTWTRRPLGPGPSRRSATAPSPAPARATSPTRGARRSTGSSNARSASRRAEAALSRGRFAVPVARTESSLVRPWARPNGVKPRRDPTVGPPIGVEPVSPRCVNFCRTLT